MATSLPTCRSFLLTLTAKTRNRDLHRDPLCRPRYARMLFYCAELEMPQQNNHSGTDRPCHFPDLLQHPYREHPIFPYVNRLAGSAGIFFTRTSFVQNPIPDIHWADTLLD